MGTSTVTVLSGKERCVFLLGTVPLSWAEIICELDFNLPGFTQGLFLLSFARRLGGRREGPP